MASTLRLLAFSGVLLLGACTTVRDITPPERALQEQRLQALDQWQLRGRLAFKDAAGEGGQANLRWQQQTTASQLRLSGPFGAGAYEVTLTPGEVTLRDAQGERTVAYTGADAVEQFLRAQLGWSFPATAARYWVLGVADPDASARVRRDEGGRVAELEQYGWRIDYLRFADVDGYELPAKLTMASARGELRLVVSRWTLAD